MMIKVAGDELSIWQNYEGMDGRKDREDVVVGKRVAGESARLYPTPAGFRPLTGIVARAHKASTAGSAAIR